MKAFVQATDSTWLITVVDPPDIVQTVVAGWKLFIELLHCELHTTSILQRYYGVKG
jgi:hypothetical protein